MLLKDTVCAKATSSRCEEANVHLPHISYWGQLESCVADFEDVWGYSSTLQSRRARGSAQQGYCRQHLCTIERKRDRETQYKWPFQWLVRRLYGGSVIIT